MKELFNIGDKIYGFCNGYFGRDDYDTKICVMVKPKYAVFEYTDGQLKGQATVLCNLDRLNLNDVEQWKNLDI